MARFDHGWGRDFAAGIGGDADAIEREVMRRCSPRTHPKIVTLDRGDRAFPTQESTEILWILARSSNWPYNSATETRKRGQTPWTHGRLYSRSYKRSPWPA